MRCCGGEDSRALLLSPTTPKPKDNSIVWICKDDGLSIARVKLSTMPDDFAERLMMEDETEVVVSGEW